MVMKLYVIFMYEFSYEYDFATELEMKLCFLFLQSRVYLSLNFKVNLLL